MIVAPDDPWLLVAAVLCAAAVGRVLTATVLPLLEHLEACFSQESATPHASEHAPADQRVLEGCDAGLGASGTEVRRPRRGWASLVPVAGWWLGSAARPDGWRLAATLEGVAVAVGALGWCWEVAWLMQVPRAFVGMPEAVAWVPTRLVAHLVLAGFLAAATWCDLRYRVIPDAITVPGLLVGIVVVTFWPGVLLPVGCILPVEPATVLAAPDVLGLAGPLGCGGMGGVSLDLRSWAGLVVLAVGFVLWWSVGTAADPKASWWRDPRSFVLAGGLGFIAATWLLAPAEAKPRHLLALATSLMGAVGAGGLIVFTREAASRALGKEAMGLGDATLMAMTGAWLGWQICVIAFFVAAFLGLAHGVLGWIRRRETELAFGPSLCLATMLVLVGWRWVWEFVEPIFLQPLDLLIVLAVVVGLTGLTLAIWSRLRGLLGLR